VKDILQEYLLKIKGNIRLLGVSVGTLILAVLVGYALGVASSRSKTPSNGSNTPIIERNYCPDDNPQTSKNPENLHVFASKRGKYYYFAWCSGLSKLKSSNVVTFKSQGEAESGGYLPSKDCPKPPKM